MYIFIDTNVYFDNWFLKNPAFEKLAHYCRDSDATLLVSEVVIEEVQSKYHEKVEKANKEIAELSRLLSNLGHEKATLAGVAIKPYDFQYILTKVFPGFKVIRYDDVSHKLLVGKALSGTRPFTNKEKGYRDALIWHSLLNFLKADRSGSKVAFISENSKDFLDLEGGNPRIHPGLAKEYQEEGIANPIEAFISLRKFLDTNKIITTEGIDEERLSAEFLPAIDDLVEEAAVAYLQAMARSEMQTLFLDAGMSSQLASLMLDATWSVSEGIEDSQITSSEQLNSDRVYITYDFNMRALDVQWTVRGSDYFANKLLFDEFFYSALGDDEFIHLNAGVRCYFECSAILATLPLESKVEELSIDRAWLRQL